MAYSTLTDILEQISEIELIQLTDDAGAGVVDDTAVTRAIEDADAEIDGYLGSRYPVPMVPTPQIIRKFSVDIAIWNLFSRRVEPDEHRKQRYENAIRFLANVAKGLVSIGTGSSDGTPGAIESSNAPEMAVTNPPRVFSRGSMGDW